MPTSTQTLTRTQIVKMALRRLGVPNPSADEMANAVLALNMRLKTFDAEGKWLWAISNTESTLTLSAGTGTYTTGALSTNIATDIVRLETFSLYIGSQHTPIGLLSKSEALDPIRRDLTGQPLWVYLERQPLMSANKLHVFPVPTGTYTAKYTYRRRLYDFTGPSDDPDCPQGWEMALVAGNASDLAPEYGIPLDERQLLKADANIEFNRQLADNTDTEVSSTGRPVPTSYF